LNEIDPVRVNALQRVAVEDHAWASLLIARDVIHVLKLFFLFHWGRRYVNPAGQKRGRVLLPLRPLL
jgi:beta-glucosidase